MKPTAATGPDGWPAVFAVVFGGLLGLALLKFGNPVVLDRLVEPPNNLLEYIFQAWPVRWGYGLLLGCAILSFTVLRVDRAVPRWVLLLPTLWFIWQLVAAFGSIDPRLTRATLLHFGACLLCFFLGLFALGRVRQMNSFWIGLLLAFTIMLWMGFEQQYGGLEATRKMFYAQPDWQQYPPDYIKKIESNRIFSTLVYPNALAGAILLLAPAMLMATWRLSSRWSDLSRAVLVGSLGYGAAACLYWSGSKSGWLIAMVLILASLLRHPFSKRIKVLVVSIILATGLIGFFVKYAPYFRRGAPSVSARFDYWKAAVQTAVANPILGTGPGTFSVAYRQIKPPDAEMAQLAHNDYLEQASDSGLIGLLSYTAFILGSIALFSRVLPLVERNDLFAVWLGLLGWSLQSFVEFLLYIPALGWTAFALLGWLWAESSAGTLDLSMRQARR